MKNMKKIISLILICLLISNAFAQRRRGTEIKWLSLALKGGYGGNVFLNKDVLSDPNVKVNYMSPHYVYGGRFGITYGDNIGVNIEPLWSTFNQEYSIKGVTPYTKTQKFKSFDFLVSLRFISSYGFYLEAGPQFSTLKSAAVTNSISGSFNEYLNGADYKENFANKFTSVAFGFGYAAINGDRVQLFLGLRANYGLGNFVENSYFVLGDGFYQQGTYTGAKTSPVSYKLMVELNYFFGFWGDATCGRGRLMFFQ